TPGACCLLLEAVPKGRVSVRGGRNLRPWWLGARSGERGSGIHPAGPWIRCSCWQTLWFVVFVFRSEFGNVVVIKEVRKWCGACVVFWFCTRLLMMNWIGWTEKRAEAKSYIIT